MEIIEMELISREHSISPQKNDKEEDEDTINIQDSETESSTKSRDHSHEIKERNHSRLKRERSPQFRERSRSPHGDCQILYHHRSHSSHHRNSKINDFNNRSRRTVRDKDCRVYVTNLSYETKWMELKDVMKKFGSVEHVEILTDDKGRSNGTAIVEFASTNDAVKILRSSDGIELGGRPLKLREDIMSNEKYRSQLKSEKLKQKTNEFKNPDALSINGGLASKGFGQLGIVGGLGSLFGVPTIQSQLFTLLNSKNDELSSTVFVNNLDYNINWQRLKDLFRRAGNCIRSDVSLDNEKRSKGYGTVIYETPMEALIAIAIFNKLEVGNRPMTVRLDRLASLNDILNQLGISSSDITISTVIQINTMALLSIHASTNVAALGGLGILGNLSNRIDNNKQNINRSPFPFGGLGNHLSNGLQNNHTISNSLENNRSEGARSSSRFKERRRRNSGDSYGGGCGGGYGRGGGDSGRSHELANECKVFVRNLPFSTTWQDLKDKFVHAGKVTHALIMTDDKLRSKGYGTVSFDSKESAMKAIDLFNGTEMDGRQIQVRCDWSRER